MQSDISEEIRDTELFMMAQFIDVINILESYENIEDIKSDIKNRKKIYLEYIKRMGENNKFISLNLHNESIDKKIEKCSEIYSTSEEYRTILKKLEIKYSSIANKLAENDKEELKDLENIICELSNYKVYMAYKVGLVDGIKIKNECT